MDIELVNKIKRLTIIALASDDELIETIVLKGGNAIDLLYGHSPGTFSRTSFDLDFSVEDEFFRDEEEIKMRIEKTLVNTFRDQGYRVIDYKFGHKPKNRNEATAEFWGGYLVTFKVLEQEHYEKLKGNIEAQRRSAIELNPNHSPVFELEFSKFEYVGKKEDVKVDGYSIYVYTSEMIVFEKLRAICQQLPDYADIIPSHSSRARARDFYDIHLIMEMHGIDPDTTESKELITHIFEAKKVPLSFIRDIRHHKYIHSADWDNVIDTFSAQEKKNVEEFDFYFNYILERFESLTFPSDGTGSTA